MADIKVGIHSINPVAFVGVSKTEFKKMYKGKFSVDLDTVYKAITTAIKDQNLNKKGRK